MTGDSGVTKTLTTIPRELIPPPRGPIGRFLLVWWLIRNQKNSLPKHRYLSDVARCTLIRDSGWTRKHLFAWFFRDLTGSVRSLPATMPIVFIFALASLALLPLSHGPALWHSDESATAFLSVLWQVMAGTLGIVVAAVLFLYEAYGSSIKGRYGITLTEYSSESGVTRLVGLLIASLALTGLVLLGWGDGAPRGWAGFLALAVSAWALGSLPRAFNSIAKLVGASEIHEMRRKYLKPRIAQAVRDDLLEFRMRSELQHYLTSAGLEPTIILNRDQKYLLVAAASGVVTDIDLHKLAPALQPLTGSQIYIPLFYRVRKGSAIAVAAAKQGAGASKATEAQDAADVQEDADTTGTSEAQQGTATTDAQQGTATTDAQQGSDPAEATGTQQGTATTDTQQGSDPAEATGTQQGTATTDAQQGSDPAEAGARPARHSSLWSRALRRPLGRRRRRSAERQDTDTTKQGASTAGATEAQHGTEAADAAGATEAQEVTEATDALEDTETTEQSAEATEATEATEAQQDTETAEQGASTVGPLEARFLVTSIVGSTTRLNDVTYFNELHLDALRAIREKSKAQVDLNVDLYEEVVRELLDLDQRLRERGLMSPVTDTNLLSTLRNHLFIQFHECLEIRNEEAARAVSWAAISIMHHAVDVGQLQVARGFLRLAGMMAISEVN
jgi:hypothetical protein